MDDVELVARYIAARKMGLIKDIYGHRLPDEFWTRYQDKARELLAVNPQDDVLNIVEMLVQPS